MKARIIAGNKCYLTLGHLLKKKYRTHSLGVGLYKTKIRPVVIYGAESWTLMNKMERILRKWERKILGKMYGPTYRYGHWRIKMNQEMFDKFKSPDIVPVSTVHGFEWLGHGVKMDGERTVKKLQESKPGGGRVDKGGWMMLNWS
jgi:hypothetical protein